jgi:hypothetical protein
MLQAFLCPDQKNTVFINCCFSANPLPQRFSKKDFDDIDINTLVLLRIGVLFSSTSPERFDVNVLRLLFTVGTFLFFLNLSK